ncbi:MAG: uroporphyrinogen decarboxylase, partial [Myxococcales bacterium]|nr:uroporphyrinogen decarboxylase [Myxococcales bacterium]
MTTTPLFLRALAGEDTDIAPVWFMRQAGRFLPEYRALKEKHSFWELARTPELACEVTLQPVRRLGVDAAILFQDIMTPLPPMGVDIDFTPGPVIAAPIRTLAQVAALRVPDPGEIAPFVPAAIRLIREACPVPLIGFGGAPLTLATYLIEGKGSKDYATLRTFLRTEPSAAHALLEKLTELSITYLREQVEAGAQAIQLFDSWIGLHDEDVWLEFGHPYNQRVLTALGALGVPRIFLAVAAAHLYPALHRVDCEAFSVDWRTPLDRVRPLVGGRTLQGNLDPAILCAPFDVVRPHVDRVLASGRGGGHVFNLGHGMLPTADTDVVRR